MSALQTEWLLMPRRLQRGFFTDLKGTFMISNRLSSTPPQMRFVAYYHVSTDKQGRSGLRLEAQVTAVENYVRRFGSEIIACTQLDAALFNAITEQEQPPVSKALS